jgi:hypothetical protein
VLAQFILGIHFFLFHEITNGFLFLLIPKISFMINNSTFGAERMDATGEITCGFQVIEQIGFPAEEDVETFDPHQGLAIQPNCCFFFIDPSWLEILGAFIGSITIILGLFTFKSVYMDKDTMELN